MMYSFAQMLVITDSNIISEQTNQTKNNSNSHCCGNCAQSLILQS